MHHATVAAGLVHRDGVFLLEHIDAHAGMPLLQAVCDRQTKHPRTNDPHSLPAHGAPSGSSVGCRRQITARERLTRSHRMIARD